MKTEEEYQPFGEEWKNELMKMPKIQIIALYRQLALEYQEYKEYHKQKMEEVMPKSKKLSNRKELSLWNYWDATTSEDRVDIVERAFKMIEAQKKYIELLSEELDELAVLAHSRGWRSKRAEQGEQMNYFTGNLSGWVIPNT